MSFESAGQSTDDIWSALKGAEEVAHRGVMDEAEKAGRVSGFYYGLASQQVFETEDGKLILRESTFESDGRFVSEISLIDPESQSGVSWRGQAMNNPELDGVRSQLSSTQYQKTKETVESLLQTHPKQGS